MSNYNENKKTEKKKHPIVTAIVVIIVILLLLLAGIFLPRKWNLGHKNSNDISLGTAVKLEVFNGIPDEAVNGLKSSDVAVLAEYAMNTVGDLLIQNGIDVSSGEKGIIQNALTEKLTALLNIGAIEFDESGNLTNLSKSYIANSILLAFMESYPDLDQNISVDAGTVSYIKIVELSEYLQQIDKNNDTILDCAENIKLLKELLTGESGTLTPDELKTLLDALRTYIEMGGYQPVSPEQSDEKVDEEYLAKIAQLQEAINKMNETQLILTANLDAAVENLSQIAADLENNSQKITTMQGDIEDIRKLLKDTQAKLSEPRESLDELKKELLALIDASRDKTEKELKNTKETLERLVEDNKAAAAEELEKTKKELLDALEQAKKDANALSPENYEKM